MGGRDDTGRDDTGRDDTGRDDTGPDDTGPDDTGPDDTGPDDTGGERTRRFTRRQVLTMVGIGAGGLASAGAVGAWIAADEPSRTAGAPEPRPAGTGTTTSTTPPGPRAGAARWSDPATWGGEVPGAGDVAVVRQPVLLDVDASVAGVRVEAGAELVFDGGRSRTLTSAGNVVVAGALRARPEGPGVVHRLAFVGIDERRVVGGHAMAPVDTDVGLWVVEKGVLDLQGSPKRAWAHLTGAARAGDTTIAVADAAGWRAGDEIVVTPTEALTPDTADDDRSFAFHHDRRTITAVDGTTVTLDEPLEWSHPVTTVRAGVTRTAEVLNLTRNVRIEGTAEGRAHVMVLAARPQAIAHVGLRYLGPNRTEDDAPDYKRIFTTVGRYALHFHQVGDAARGTTVDGVVAYDCGNHAFVPHGAHGVSFRDCVAHDTVNTPYWWDSAGQEAADSQPTDDLLWERCVASHFWPGVEDTFSTSGFWLGAGRGNVARGCVVTGNVQGSDAGPAYLWPERSRNGHVWVFEDCVAHNNASSAIYVWQNNEPRTIVDRFTAYHNNAGILAGAYSNLTSYRDCTLHANRGAGVLVTAVPDDAMAGPGETMTLEGIYVDQAGLSEFAVYIDGHHVDSSRVTRISGGDFRGATKAQVGFPDGGENSQRYELVDCTYQGNAFWLTSDLATSNDIVVRDAAHGAIRLRRVDQDGDLRNQWNARVIEV